MAAISNLVLADGQATPVNKTFNPEECTSALSRWTDRSSGIAIGMPAVTLSVNRTPSNHNVIAKVEVPILETVTGDAGGYAPTPKVAYVMRGEARFVLPVRSTLQQRKDVRAFVSNLLSNAVLTAAVNDFEKPF